MTWTLQQTLCGFVGPGDICTFPKGHDRHHSWERGDPLPDPIDAFLASPAARDELATVLHGSGYTAGVPGQDRGEATDLMAELILAAWRKGRA